MSFEENCELLKKIGAVATRDYEYRGEPPNRDRCDLSLFTHVQLPLTPEEWCQLCMSSGDCYIGGCCGSSSAVQDHVNSIFRDGCARIVDLAEIAEAMIYHDGESSFFGPAKKPLPQLVEQFAGMDPWEKIALTWHLVKDYYRPDVPYAIRKDIPEVERATSALRDGLTYLDICRMFDRGKDISDQDAAEMMLVVYRMLPSLKTLNEKIDELAPPPFEGFAIIDKEKGPEEVAKNGRGLCIFKDRAEVDRLFALWRQDEDEHQEKRGNRKVPIDEKLGVRRVRVSSDKGLEFLD